MKAFFFILTSIIFLLACSSNSITNIHNPELLFAKIQSDFIVEDINNYDCEKIDTTTLKHVLSNAIYVTDRYIHDHFSTIGCSIKGQLIMNNKNVGFFFDYGGIIYFENGKTIACAEECCKNDFQYCTWEDPANIN